MASAACPRCGYDQTGVIHSWPAAGACPLRSACAECGGALEWSEVLDPANAGSSFEYGRRPSWSRWVRTSLGVFRPSQFWQANADNPRRWDRLALFVAPWLAFTHAAALLIAAIGGSHLNAAPWWLCPYAARFRVPTPDPNAFYVADFATIAAMTLGLSLLLPLWLLVLGIAPWFRLDPAGIVRALLLSTPVIVAGVLLGVAHFYGVTWLEAHRANPSAPSPLRFVYLSTFLAYPAWLWWWWRCCLAHGLGARRASLAAFALLLLAIACTFPILSMIES